MKTIAFFFKLSLILYWLLTYHSSLAQFAVSGRVLNQADKKSIIGASVFLSNATIGTITQTDGSFILSKINPGQYELVISSIGFNTFHKPINLVSSSLDLGNIEVSVKTTVLKDVVIRSTADSEWKKYYDWFKDGFLGHSGLEKECRIRNPDILHFNYRENGDSLIASCDDFLIIDNKALGYKVKYLLDNFYRTDSGRSISYKGSVLFENMKGTASQQLR